VIISIFASLIAPFGTFVVNGFKKAFRIKVRFTESQSQNLQNESLSEKVGLDASLGDVLRV